MSETAPGPGVVVSAKEPSTMTFDDGNQWMIWRDREDCVSMTQPEIIQSMLEEAGRGGYEPCDINYAGIPNVYLRGKWEVDADGKTERHLSDGFAMFVKMKDEK